jgi:hypothetical protein
VQRAYQVANLGFAIPESDRGELLRFVYREMGLRDDEIRMLVKTDEEVSAEQQAEAAGQALSVRPQPFSNSPAGLNVAQPGGRS